MPILVPMSFEQFKHIQKLGLDYSGWRSRGYHNYPYERKLFGANNPFEALRELLKQEDPATSLLRLNELCECGDVDLVNKRSYAARVIEDAHLYTPEEVAIAKKMLKDFNDQ